VITGRADRWGLGGLWHGVVTRGGSNVGFSGGGNMETQPFESYESWMETSNPTFESCLKDSTS